MAPISFNQIPAGLRVPFLYAEFDSSKAQQGASVMPFKVLVLGQKLATGSKAAGSPVRVTSFAQAQDYFGEGSMLQGMLARIFDNNKFTEVQVIALDDPGAGAQAAGSLTTSGPATADGTLALYIAGRKIEVAVKSGDSANAVATAIGAAINAATSSSSSSGNVAALPVTSSVSTNVVTVTARHKGLLGNGIDLRLNYQDTDKTPAGVAVVIVAMTGGTSAPVLTSAISAMGEIQWNVIACAFNDATSLSAVEAELLDRWGPSRQNDGVAISAKDDTSSNLASFGTGRNSKHVVMQGTYKMPSPSWELAAGLAAVVAYYGNIDPARPFQTLPIGGLVPPAIADRFKNSEREILLKSGIATHVVSADGLVTIERAITMYQKNSQGAADTAFLDLNTVMTLSYLRYDFRTMWLTKYPRHKLASDSTRVGAGQAIMTPKLARAEAIAKFRQWEEMGLVENVDQFKRDLIVERNATDVNRLDFMLPPDLMNQLRVVGVQIGFLL